MADVSVLSDRLGRLLKASGWEVRSQRFIIRATEPAFEPISRTWMAGAYRSLSESDIRAVAPSRIIVDDFTPEDQLIRLAHALEELGNGGTVTTYSRFVDEFWGADSAVRAALLDAENLEADFAFELGARGLGDRHVNAKIRLGSLSVPDHRALESGLPESGTCLAILADAGLGKSELLRYHEWRYAMLYRSASQGRRSIGLPPVALRVPLRDFKSLSLDYVAHNLSQPAQTRGRPALHRISSGAVLRELIVQRRLLLLLDGLDEVSADSATVDAGISEWRTVVRDGGHFVLTSRAGHEASSGAIARRFKPEEIGHLNPLEGPEAHALLTKRGATEVDASQVIAALTGPSAGIPLFLLLANHVGLASKPDRKISESRTLVLLTLLELFCERDEDRVGVSAGEQIEVLTEIAEWTMEAGPLTQEELLLNLGIDDADPRARIIRNPHALLLNNNDRIEFKFREFGALFTAKSIAQSWQSFGFRSIAKTLRTHNLDDLVVEYLARLVLPAVLSGAWVASETDSDGVLLLRRNLLAIALARVSDVAHAESANARAAELAKALGNRSLVNLTMSGLYLDRFDFAGWRLRQVHGVGGTLSYCDNLWRTDHDDSVAALITEGCTFSPPAPAEVNLSIGADRLRRVVRPLRRKNGGPVVKIMSRDEVTDSPAWDVLVRLHLAEASGKASVARWILNGDGVRILTAFAIADAEGSDALSSLLDMDRDVRALVEQLARR